VFKLIVCLYKLRLIECMCIKIDCVHVCKDKLSDKILRLCLLGFIMILALGGWETLVVFMRRSPYSKCLCIIKCNQNVEKVVKI